MQFWQFLLFCSVILCGHSVFAINHSAHRREKIWLWMMYNFVCDREGAAKQQLIWPQNPDHKHQIERNIGTGPEGRFTWEEFINRFSNLSPAMGAQPGSLRDPLVNGVDAALQDMGKSYGGIMHTPGLSGKSGDLHTIWDALHAEYLRYRESPVLNRLLDKIGPPMDKLAMEIANLRVEDNQNFLAERLKTGTTSKPPLMPDAIVTTEDSKVPGGPKYNKIDFKATLSAYTEPNGKLKSTFVFPSREKFFQWIDENGKEVMNQDLPAREGKAPPAYTHHRMKVTWLDLEARTLLSPILSRVCPTIP